jgi:hypothetical protein
LYYTSKLSPEDEIDMELYELAKERPGLNVQLFNISNNVFEYSKYGGIGKVVVYDLKTDFLSYSSLECMSSFD